ncbi:MAG: DMT family transporter [Pseudomonadota bacterium]
MPDPDVDPLPPDPPAGLNETLAERWAALPGNVRGGILFIVASAFFSVMIAMIKLVGDRLHVTEILLFRQVTMVTIAAPAIIRGWPGSLHSARPKLQVIRVGLAFCAMTLGFSAVIHLPLAEATVISFSKAFFTTLLAIVILGEVVRLPRWTGLVLGFIGILIIVWPSEAKAFEIWHVVAIASAVCVSLVMVIIRTLAQIDQPVTILTYQAVGVGALMVGPAIWFWQWPTATEWALLIGIGVLSWAAQYLNILSFRVGEASALAPLEYTRLLFATVLGLWLFAEWPEPRVWLGAAIIIAAALYVLHRERKAKARA